MKNLIILFLTSLFILASCQDDKSILEPNNDFANNEMSKGRPILSLDDDVLKFTEDSDLSDLTDVTIKSQYSQSFTVDGRKGGKVSVKHSWINQAGMKVNLGAQLTIPSGAYEGVLTFGILFDLNTYAVELYPSPFTFDNPVFLSYLVSNADLSNFGSDISFDYLDGETENLKYDYLEIDIANRTLEVSGAHIPHFSRYGWTRTTTSK